MKKLFANPYAVFIVSALVITLFFLLVPLNLFDAEVQYNINGNRFTREMKLALSYFAGWWVSPADLKDVETFRLTRGGYMLVFLFTIGFPALLAYRVSLKKKKQVK